MNGRNILVFVFLGALLVSLTLSARAFTTDSFSPEGRSIYSSIAANAGTIDVTSKTEQSTNSLSFRSVYSYALGPYWSENHIAVADFDKDGEQDVILLATAVDVIGSSYLWNSKLILLHNEGDLKFSPTVLIAYPPDSYGYGLVTDDMNNDGWPDLVVREQWSTHVLLNNKNGGFNTAWSGITGAFGSVATGDLNEDGWFDFVSGIQAENGAKLETYLSSGIDTAYNRFWESPLYGDDNAFMSSAYLSNTNNDAHTDLISLVSQSDPGQLLVYNGNSTGTFTESWSTLLSGRAYRMTSGRVNLDPYDDVAVSARKSNTSITQSVKVLTGQGNNTLSQSWESPDLQSALNLALTDFNLDGYDDLFVGTFSDGAMRVFQNDKNGEFQQVWLAYLPGYGYAGMPADLDNDSYPELITVTDLDAGATDITNGMIYIYDLVPTIGTNYLSGAPGSFFLISGNGFPAGVPAAIAVNGQALGTIMTDSQGLLKFVLDTTEADEGYYAVSASVNPTAMISFRIDASAPLRPKDSDATVLDLPGGIAHKDWVMIPTLFR